MKYHELASRPKQSAKRVGRGIAAGQGKTAGRGTKGQKSRTGSKRRFGFEGGQNPLMQRMPKLRGFRSMQPKAELIFTEQLDQFSGKTVTAGVLAEAGLITSRRARVKLLHKGSVNKKVTVKLSSASVAAVEAIQNAGGIFEPLKENKRDAGEARKY